MPQSLLRWLSRKAPASSSRWFQSRSDVTAAEALDPGQTPERRERSVRRKLLVAVISDCMLDAERMTSTYRARVLALDRRGDQFLVMMDLTPSLTDDLVRLAEIERGIVWGARSRHGITVKAVYWRQHG